MSGDGHSFHHLHCLGHAAKELLDRSLARGDDHVLVHVNGCRIHIRAITREDDKERQVAPVVDRIDEQTGEVLP